MSDVEPNCNSTLQRPNANFVVVNGSGSHGVRDVTSVAQSAKPRRPNKLPSPVIRKLNRTQSPQATATANQSHVNLEQKPRLEAGCRRTSKLRQPRRGAAKRSTFPAGTLIFINAPTVQPGFPGHANLKRPV